MDRVLLIPAAQAPLKPAVVQASAADRLAMLQLAVADLDGLEVCDLEIRRGGINYTIDTVRELRGRFPSDELSWIIGADQLACLAEWRDIALLAAELEFLCAIRPGHVLQAPTGIPGLRWRRLAGPEWNVSSSDLRTRIKQGESLVGLIPNKTIEYLDRNRLYR